MGFSVSAIKSKTYNLCKNIRSVIMYVCMCTCFVEEYGSYVLIIERQRTAAVNFEVSVRFFDRHYRIQLYRNMLYLMNFH
jgi:hypothetical protein